MGGAHHCVVVQPEEPEGGCCVNQSQGERTRIVINGHHLHLFQSAVSRLFSGDPSEVRVLVRDGTLTFGANGYVSAEIGCPAM
jgi:hypothetical protein